MLTFIFKKLLNNKWLILCLTFGAVLTTAMVSSIPLYTQGTLQRMLVKDLENYQSQSGKFPGDYNIDITFFEYLFKGNDLFNSYLALDNKVRQMEEEYKIPYLSYTREISLEESKLDLKRQSDMGLNTVNVSIKSLEGMDKHIKIIDGKMFSKKKSDGTYEVLVSENGFNNIGLQLNETYDVNLQGGRGKIKVKVVGIYGMNTVNDPYWSSNQKEYDKSIFIDFGLMFDEFKNNTLRISNANWNYALDYHQIKIDNVARTLDIFYNQQSWFNKYSNSVKFDLTALPLLKQYTDRQKQLTTALWVLIVPVLLILMLYIFMTSANIIKSDENEIAVLKSRGVKSSNIFYGYVLESLLLGGTAFLAGPPLGLFICRMIGASDGFLEFVQRSGLPLSLNLNAYIYALIAFVLFSITMSIPAFLASRTTIVIHKQKKSRAFEKALWEKFYIDIVILLLSIYGLYRYYSQQKILGDTGIKATDLDIDPLLFLITTFFVLGTGMLFLRCFPYIIGFIFRLGKKYWSPVPYASFIQIGRSQGREKYLMIFIILSIAMGIFGANSARTINRNIEDKINYQVGCDISILARWESIQGNSQVNGNGQAVQNSGYNVFVEPPFEQYANLNGVDIATKVLIEDAANAKIGSKSIINVQLMGVTPNEFGKIVKFRSDLLPFHINQYLNLLSGAPKGLIVSSNIRDSLKAKAGDPISVSFESSGTTYSFDGVIYAFVDYWPAFNPRPKEAGKEPPSLVVGNLSYIQQATCVEPYQVWIKKKDGFPDEVVYNDISSKKMNIKEITSSKQLLINKKNDPMLQGINGILTLGFIMTMLISMIGFLIFWILSIKSRVLQFGIFRAIGLSLASVLKMIVWEQILISGTSIFAGIMIGGAASKLFIPLLQLIYSAQEQVPPFKVTAFARDYIKIYSSVGFMLVIGILVLSIIIKGIKINQAIKLGEE